MVKLIAFSLFKLTVKLVRMHLLPPPINQQTDTAREKEREKLCMAFGVELFLFRLREAICQGFSRVSETIVGIHQV